VRARVGWMLFRLSLRLWPEMEFLLRREFALANKARRPERYFKVEEAR
jgi:hypothetical protein